MKSNSRKIIAVIVGAGDLPKRIIAKLCEIKTDFVVLSIAGAGSEEYPQFELGEIGRMLAYVNARGVTDVVFCGAVKRPSMFSLKLDNVGKRWLRKLGIRAFLGDDALIKGIRNLLEQEGLRIIRPQDILDTLLAPSGVLTKCTPSEMDLKDIARGMFVLKTMAKADVGQSVVVQEGVVIAIESAEGTAEMLRRARGIKLTDKPGGVLVKLIKVGQDEAIDLPTIGPSTISEALEAKLSGIAVGADTTQIIDNETTIALANGHGIFIMGV